MNNANTTPVRFGPEHFPLGTVFEIKDEVNDDVYQGNGVYTRSSAIKTVRCVYRNGAQSYVLKTGVINALTGEESVNIDHVKRIIQRGDGPVLIDHNKFSAKAAASNIDLEYYEFTDFCIVNTPRRRGVYATLAIEDFVLYELGKIAKEGDHVDIPRLLNDVFVQTWITSEKVQNLFRVDFINKKRLRKFLKANINRYLTNLSVAAREYSKLIESTIYATAEDEPDPIDGDVFADYGVTYDADGNTYD